MNITYNVFRTEEVQAILDHLVTGGGEDVGFRLAFSLYDQHNEVGSQTRIQLDPAETQDRLERELAWTFFKDHGADHGNLKREIENIMRQLGTDRNKAISIYARRVYENASVRARIGTPL